MYIHIHDVILIRAHSFIFISFYLVFFIRFYSNSSMYDTHKFIHTDRHQPTNKLNAVYIYIKYRISFAHIHRNFYFDIILLKHCIVLVCLLNAFLYSHFFQCVVYVCVCVCLLVFSLRFSIPSYNLWASFVTCFYYCYDCYYYWWCMCILYLSPAPSLSLSLVFLFITVSLKLLSTSQNSLSSQSQRFSSLVASIHVVRVLQE